MERRPVTSVLMTLLVLLDGIKHGTFPGAIVKAVPRSKVVVVEQLASRSSPAARSRSMSNFAQPVSRSGISWVTASAARNGRSGSALPRCESHRRRDDAFHPVDGDHVRSSRRNGRGRLDGEVTPMRAAHLRHARRRRLYRSRRLASLPSAAARSA